MSRKKKALIISIIVLVAVALLLIFSPILKSQPIAIEPGITYEDTIMPKDAPNFSDKDYRRHTYSLYANTKDTYTFEASSQSDDIILINEYYEGEKKQILVINALQSDTADHTFNSTGQKIIYVEALADRLPADYTLRVTIIKGSD
jgi:hypothetical protein